MTKQSVWMPVYIGDYLGDTQRLTTEQHGAYILLLMDYWRNGPPPADDSVLCSITRLKPARFRKHKSTLLSFFKNIEGELVHGRVEAEKNKAEQNASRNSDRAKKAAEVRWQARDGDAPSNAAGNAPSNAPECPSPSSYSVSKDTGDKSPPNCVKSLFEEGVQLLTKTGSTPAAARSLIGQWRKTQKDDAVFAAIAEAKRLEISDPRTWITKRFANAVDDQSSLYASIDRTFRSAAA